MQDIATSTVDKTMWVVYSHCYPFQYQTWIRPYDEWTDGRFRKLTEGEYDEFLSRDVQQFQAEITAARSLAKR